MTKSNNNVRVRFAPSPTGTPHVGNIRTALFAWLFTRHHKGTFILRIEDTDQKREEEGSIGSILNALNWLGMDIDEGVVKVGEEKGDLGPYTQSKRLKIYQKYTKMLVESGHAFYCFCSESRLSVLRELQAQEKKPPKYDGLCIRLDPEKAKKWLAEKKSAVIRMRIPHSGDTKFIDAIKGEIKVDNSNIDYQVLQKSDGFPTYHLASVVDDHLMEISHVLRADEWLASTPKHVLLYQYFGWDAPEFIHLPIILGQDKTKLSKRHGAVSVMEYKKLGYLPEALVNFLSLLGWNPKTNQEILSREELISQFDVSKINKNSPIFETQKLDWMNKQYIKATNPADIEKQINELSVLSEEAKNFLQDEGVFQKAILLAKDRMSKLTDFEGMVSFLWKENLEYDPKILSSKDLDEEETKTILNTSLEIINAIKEENWEEENLRKTFMDYTEKNNIKRGDMLWPLRVAVTGLEQSPDVFGVMDILGKEKSIARISNAVEKLQ
jgi:glutamyl-tRNA synthetase